MAPDERRAALIEATIPLLHEHGVEVSTKQIAEAAGVAEGTIFGVFDSKNSLVVCSVVKALDPQVTLDGLAAIDRSAPLRERLTAAAELVHARFAENAQLMTAARKVVFAARDPDAEQRMSTNRERLSTALTEVIEPDAALLRRSPASVARMLLLFCGANTYGPFGDVDDFRGAELVSLLLDGMLIRSEGRSGENQNDENRGDR
jgi:AcrR family transcriptional regulator